MTKSSNQPSQLHNLLETQPPEFSFQQAALFLQERYGLSGQLSHLDSERDQNFHLVTDAQDQYVVRIANHAEDPAIVDMQARTLEHLAMVDPELPVPRVRYSLQGQAYERIQAEDGTAHLVQVITYLQGRTPREKPINPGLLKPIGTCLARLAKGLRGFFHPAAGYELLWDVKRAANLRQYVPYLTNPSQQQVVQHFLDRFTSHVLPQLPKLRAQVIHNDLTPDNMVVSEDDPLQVVGILDFGDMVHSFLAIDLAVTIASSIRRHTDPVGAAAEVVSAYHEVTPLEPLELSLLYDLVAMRLTSLITIAAWRTVLHPENEAYITGGAGYDWETLQRWFAHDPAEAQKRFLRACGFWELEDDLKHLGLAEESHQAHLSRRKRLLGPCYYLFYERPLVVLRSQGVWLYDEEDRRYLDVYNNVAHVGHCHPHVVSEISRQSRLLNTSSRYMHGLILELAEQITARMPEPLSVCMFVCTGTEANELAWRMAKLVSGNSGALISQFAYHGNSDAIIHFSTESLPAEKLPPHVQTLLPPASNTSYQQPDSGADQAIQTLVQRGHPPAMLVLDSGFTSDGIFTAPQGFLRTLYAKTRAAGGLCLADEVQAGFGRLGEHFWGFQFDQVVPDIVTMGKSMGNGHPIAAVVTRPEIAQAIAKETGYFNTYGGNPVSCAAGLAVLNVIEREGLQQNALQVGQYLIQKLDSLHQAYPMLGEPHGAGLLLGIDVTKPDGSPDPLKAKQIMNHMRERGVLIGTTGKGRNVLKIRPPIVFQQEHAEILLKALQEACAAFS